MDQYDELDNESKLVKIRREQNQLLRKKQEYIESIQKKLKAEKKSAEFIVEYLKKEDATLKEINATLKLNADAMRQYHNESKLTVDSIGRQEQGLKSISGVQSLLVDSERERLKIQYGLTSVSSEFHTGLNSIGDISKELASLTSEDVVQRDQLIKQGKDEIDNSRALLEAEKQKHESIISTYDAQHAAQQQILSDNQVGYEQSIALIARRNTLEAESSQLASELAKIQSDISKMSPQDPGYAEMVQKAEDMRYSMYQVGQEAEHVADQMSQMGSESIVKTYEDAKDAAENLNKELEVSQKFVKDDYNNAKRALKLSEENLQTAKDISKLSEQQQKFLSEQVELYDGIRDSIGKVWETFSLLFTGIRGFFATVLIGAGMLVDKISEVNKELGLTLLETNSFSLSIMGLGMIFGDAKDTAEELASQLGGMNEATFGLQLDTNIMAANLGIAGGEAASLVGSFSRLNEGSSEVALDMMRSVKETAKLSGVIPSKVMKDLANNTEAFALYGKDGGKNIAEAAVYAAKLGVGMDKLTGIADNLLDFESSITSELELSAMLGRNINLERARSLAYEGKIEEAVSETLNQLGGIEAFNQMDYFQKKQAAQLLGVSVDELQKMAANQHKVGQEVSLAQKGFDRFNESVAYMSNTLFGSILKGAGGLLVTMGQVGTGLSSMGIDTKKIFGSILSVIKAPFVGIKKAVSAVSSSISGLFKKDADGKGFFTRVGDGFSKLKGTISSVSSSISKFFKGGDDGKGFFTRVSDGFKSLKDTVISVADTIASFFKKDEEGKGFFTRMKDKFNDLKSTLSSVADTIASFFKKDEEGKGFFTRMKDGFKSIFGGKDEGVSIPESVSGRLRDARGRFISSTPNPEIQDESISENITDSMRDTAEGGTELGKTESIGDKLKDLAAGLKEMGSGKVLAGALNLIPTGIGMLLMLPGIPSLFLLSKIDISKVGDGLGNLAEGLELMGTGKVLFGAFNLIPTGIGFALMTIGAIGMGVIALLGIPLGAGLTAMSAGLTAMGNPAVFMGALGILAVGAALIPFTFALSLLKDVDVGVILSTVGALVVFGIAAAAIGSVLPLIAMGALGIGLIGLSLIPFTFALSQLKDVDMGILLTTAASLMVFGMSASMLGVLYPFIIAGSVAIGVLGLALIPFTSALSRLDGIDTSVLENLGKSIISFGFSVATLGILSPLILIGSVALLTLGIALNPITSALAKLADTDIGGISTLFDTLSSVAMKSVGIAAGLGIITFSILGLGAMIPILLLSSVAFMVFGTALMMVATASSVLATTLPTITESLKHLTEFTEGIYNLSGSILALAGSMTALSLASLVAIPLLPIIGIVGAIASPAESEATKSESGVGTEEGGSSLSSLESTIRTTNDALLMEIKGLREDLVSGKIGVNMDGDSVTSRVTKIINRSTQNVTGLKV
jgi:hypothetical protein